MGHTSIGSATAVSAVPCKLCDRQQFAHLRVMESSSQVEHFQWIPIQTDSSFFVFGRK